MRNSLFLMLAQVSGRLIRFLYLLVIARLLGPSEAGVYLYGLALYLALTGVSRIGQDIFLAQRLGKHGALPFPVLHQSLTLTLIVAGGVACLLGVFIWLTEPDPLTRLTILFFAGALIMRILTVWVRAAYIAFERPSWVPRYEIAFRGMEALGGAAALLAGGGLLVICFLHFLFWGLEAFFSCRKLHREHPGALGVGWRWAYVKKMLRVSGIFVLGATAIGLFPQISVVFMRQFQSEPALVGQFAIAMQFMTTLMIVPVAISQAFLPRLSRSFARGGGHDLITGAKLLALLLLAGAIMSAAYGPWFMVLVLGEKYVPAAELFRWLCWLFVPYAMALFLGACFNVIGGRRMAVMVLGGMTALHAGLMLAYVDTNPVLAAIASMGLGAMAAMLLAFTQTGRLLNRDGQSWWLKLLLIMAAALGLLESGLAPPMIAAPMALVLAAGLAWLMKVFDASDTQAIKRLLGRS